MSLQNDDLLLVNRGGQSFKTEYGVLKENINEDQGVTISEDPPSDPGEGDLWYNSEDGRLYVWYVNETTGIVTSVSIRNGGSGYTTQETNVETAGGAGFGLTVDIDPGVGGNFANPQVNNGGHGYNVGDYIIVVGAGHQNGTLNVTAINTASVGQWVDASPDNAGAAELWERNGSTLEPVNAGDSVDLGTGDLSAAAGTFSGRVTGDNAFVSNPPSGTAGFNVNKDAGDDGAMYVGRVGTDTFFTVNSEGDIVLSGPGNTATLRAIASSGTLRIGGDPDTTATANITLAGNGQGFFASLSGTGNRAVYSAANGQLTNSSSDATLKTNVTTLVDQTDVVKSLNPVSFNWIDTELRGQQKEVGFIAQEVEGYVPEVVGINHDGTKTVDYPKLTAVLTSALQTALTRIEALEAAVQQLKGGNS